MSAPLPAIPSASRSVDLMRATSAFVREHGTGLSDLVDILADTSAIDALCELAANLNATTPCPSVLRTAIETILEALSRVSIPDADRLGRYWGTDVGAATRWYGARLAELRTRFEALA